MNEEELNKKAIEDYEKRLREKDPYEAELKKEKEAAEEREKAAADDLTEGKIRRKREEEGGFLDEGSAFRTTAAIGTEVALNTLLDLFSFEPTSQVGGAAAINYFAQRIRGGEISKGEMAAAGLASLIPGGAQAKSLGGVLGKGIAKGAVTGAVETGIADFIDTGQIDAERVGTGALIGGAFGGVFSHAGSQLAGNQKEIQRGIRYFKGRIKGEKFAKISPEEALELGLGQPMQSRYADEITPTSAKQLQNELDIRSADLGYNIVGTRKRGNQFKIPKDISTVYLNHAEAYKKAIAGTDKTLENFPTLIWDGKRYRPKSKPLKENPDYVYLDDYLKRRMLKKLGKDRRSIRIWKQTPKDTEAGNFYRQKLKQLRQLNAEEDAAGLPRTRLRDMEMDHKNALRSVEDYTRGLSPENEKHVFDLLEKYGLFTGDDTRNLALRNRKIHKKLWPKLKAALKKLNHKNIDDFKNTKNPELEYLKYLAVDKNPKTGSTPLREYIETIKFIEEQAADEAKALWGQRLEALSKGKSTKADEIREQLIEIFGGEEEGRKNLEAFVERLKEYPSEHRGDMIRGEFERIGGFGPLDEDDLRKILNE